MLETIQQNTFSFKHSTSDSNILSQVTEPDLVSVFALHARRVPSLKCPQPIRTMTPPLSSNMLSRQPLSISSPRISRFETSKKDIISLKCLEDVKKNDIDEVNGEIQEILNRGRGKMPSKIDKISPKFDLRSSTSELFRALSHSPTPDREDSISSQSEEMELGNSTIGSQTFPPYVMTPPIRKTNPIMLNSTFILDKEKKKTKTVEIGLFSISPPPMMNDELQFLRNDSLFPGNISLTSSSDGVDTFNRKMKNQKLPKVEEDEESIFHLD